MSLFDQGAAVSRPPARLGSAAGKPLLAFADPLTFKSSANSQCHVTVRAKVLWPAAASEVPLPPVRFHILACQCPSASDRTIPRCVEASRPDATAARSVTIH